MRSLPLLFVVLCAACGTADGPRRTPVLLPGPTAAPVDVTRENRVLAASDRSPPVAAPVEPVPPGGATITYRTVTQIVEKPVEVVREVPAQPVYSYDGRVATDYAPYYGPPPCGDEPFIPVNTIVGAGIGTLIGDANGHAADGAWIGAGIGLMLDLGRLCW